MIRILTALAILLFFNISTGEAGWLTDKLMEAGEELGSRLIDDTSDTAYKGTKEGAGKTVDNEGDTNTQRTEEHTEDPTPSREMPQEDSTQPHMVSQTSTSKSKKNYSSQAVRSDLQFSADTEMVDAESPSERMKGKMFVDGARLRMDMNTPDGSISYIVTGAKTDDRFYMLMHEQKSYMTSLVGDAEDDPWVALRGTDNPCEDYRKSQNLGQKTINGRKSVQWNCSDPEEQEEPANISLWIDSKLNIPVKMEGSDGTRYELKNIKEGKPSAEKFKTPAGYREITLFGQTGNVSTGSETLGTQAPSVKAGSLPDDLKDVLSKAGVPIYPGAIFCVGSTSAGLRFATKDSVEKVKKWYRAQRSNWSLIDKPKYEIWVLYEGPPGIAMMGWLEYNLAQVSVNKDLPDWHDLPKDMTTEIVLGVANQYK